MTEQRLEKLWNKAYYDYLEREEAQELIDYYKNMEQENKHLNLQLDQALKDYEELLVKIYKAKEYIKEKYDYVLGDDTFLDHDELVDRKRILHVLEILGDKENE